MSPLRCLHRAEETRNREGRKKTIMRAWDQWGTSTAALPHPPTR